MEQWENWEGEGTIRIVLSREVIPRISLRQNPLMTYLLRIQFNHKHEKFFEDHLYWHVENKETKEVTKKMG